MFETDSDREGVLHEGLYQNQIGKEGEMMGDILYDLGVSIFGGLILSGLVYLIERHFRISILIQKLLHRSSPCQFEFSCNLQGDGKKISQNLYSVLKQKGYRLEFIEKGYRTTLKAMKENLEILQIRAISDEPFQISLDPVQTTIQSAGSRLCEITSILQKVKDDSSSKIESASFQVVLPYNPGVDIKVPKNVRVDNYRVEMLTNGVKIILSIGNKINFHSTDFIQLAETYRSLI